MFVDNSNLKEKKCLEMVLNCYTDLHNKGFYTLIMVNYSLALSGI